MAGAYALQQAPQYPTPRSIESNLVCMGKGGEQKRGRQRTRLASSITSKKYAQGRRRSAGSTMYAGIVEQQTM